MKNRFNTDRRDRLTDIVFDLQIKEDFGLLPMIVLDCVRSTIERHVVSPDPRFCKIHTGLTFANIPRQFISKYLGVNRTTVGRHLAVFIDKEVLLREDLTDHKVEGYWYAFHPGWVIENLSYFQRIVPPIPNCENPDQGSADCTTPWCSLHYSDAKCTANPGAACTTPIYINNNNTLSHENEDENSVFALNEDGRFVVTGDLADHPAVHALTATFPICKGLSQFHREYLAQHICTPDMFYHWRDNVLQWASRQVNLDPQNLQRLVTNFNRSYYGSGRTQKHETLERNCNGRPDGQGTPGEGIKETSLVKSGYLNPSVHKAGGEESGTRRAMPANYERRHTGRPSGTSFEDFLDT